MKTLTFKSLLALAVVLIAFQASAQNMVSTRIDVRGSRYSDQMWVFAVPSCTRDFDNGWDGFKMLGTSKLIPQIFAMEANGNFQIDAVPDMTDTYIAFKAGEDSVYTFTFNNENLNLMYTDLFIVDSVANKTVSIFATGTKYTFNVKQTIAPERRFKLIAVPIPPVVVPVDTVVTPPVVVPPVVTSVDTVVTPPVVVPPVVTPPVVVPPVVTPPVVVPPVVTPPVVVPDPNKDKNKDDKNCKDKKIKKIKIHSSKKDIVIDNDSKKKGKVKIYNAYTGRILKTTDFKANGTTTINSMLPTGTYAVNCTTDEESTTENIVIK